MASSGSVASSRRPTALARPPALDPLDVCDRQAGDLELVRQHGRVLDPPTAQLLEADLRSAGRDQDLDQSRLLLVEGPDEGQVLAEAAVGGRHCPTLIPLRAHRRKLRSQIVTLHVVRHSSPGCADKDQEGQST